MKSFREILNDLYAIKESEETLKPEAPPKPAKPFSFTSKDIGNDFFDSFEKIPVNVKETILHMLYSDDAKNPHTKEEVIQKYISAPANDRHDINDLLNSHVD
jgi:hypothetical protein